MRHSKDSVDRYFDYDLHLESRTVWIGPSTVSLDGESHTDGAMAERAVKALHLLSIGPKADEPILIQMNNWGGSWFHGMAVFDAIKRCPGHVTIECYGYCMSMGSIILQAADERVMMPNATMMIHDGSEALYDHARNVEAWAAESKKSRHRMYEIYAERSGKSKSFWAKRCTIDFIMNAHEAVELGLADRVWKPSK